ncbi:hypothetical protein Tco_0160844, partial [Tanacetum coccineum]
HPSTSQPQKTQTPRELTRRDTEIPQSSGPTEHVEDEVFHKEKGDCLVRVATTVSSLEAAQDNGNIVKTQSKETLNEPSSPGTSSGGGPSSCFGDYKDHSSSGNYKVEKESQEAREEEWKRISDKRTKNKAKNDKTEHGMEEREKAKVKIKVKVQKVKVKVNPEKSTV